MRDGPVLHARVRVTHRNCESAISTGTATQTQRIAGKRRTVRCAHGRARCAALRGAAGRTHDRNEAHVDSADESGAQAEQQCVERGLQRARARAVEKQHELKRRVRVELGAART